MMDTIKKYLLVSGDGKTKATVIPDRGGLVSSLVLPFVSGQREVLFLHDYAWEEELHDLPGGIPFLFPICGRISRGTEGEVYLYEGKQYHLKIHGFSWFEKWAVESVTENSIEIVLRDNENTLAQYPFHFEVRLKYEVLSGKLLCHQSYKNNEAERTMPYYAGFHPYFLMPIEKEKVFINFSAARHLKYNRILTDIVGEQSILNMPSSITDPVINEQLSVLRDEKLATLTFPNGDVIKINVLENPDYFPCLQLYTIPEKPFFCVEHWMSFPNAMNTVAGVRWLLAGQQETSTYCIGI